MANRTIAAVGAEAGESWLRAARRTERGGRASWTLAGLDLPADPVPGRVLPGIGRADAVCALCSAAVEVLPLRVRAAAAELVVDEARRQLGEHLDGSVFDYAELPRSVIRPGDDSAVVLAFAVPRPVVERVLGQFAAVGIEVSRLITPACALAPCVGRDEPGRRFLLFATGEDASSVAVVQDGSVLLERIVPWGRATMTVRLQHELALDAARARLVLTRAPADGDTVSAGALRRILASGLQDLVQQTAGCLAYCDSFYRPAEITAAVLTGPLAACAPLAQALSASLRVTIAGLDLADCDEYATAAGCALWPAEVPA